MGLGVTARQTRTSGRVSWVRYVGAPPTLARGSNTFSLAAMYGWMDWMAPALICSLSPAQSPAVVSWLVSSFVRYQHDPIAPLLGLKLWMANPGVYPSHLWFRALYILVLVLLSCLCLTTSILYSFIPHSTIGNHREQKRLLEQSNAWEITRSLGQADGWSSSPRRDLCQDWERWLFNVLYGNQQSESRKMKKQRKMIQTK